MSDMGYILVNLYDKVSNTYTEVNEALVDEVMQVLDIPRGMAIDFIHDCQRNTQHLV